MLRRHTLTAVSALLLIGVIALVGTVVWVRGAEAHPQIPLTGNTLCRTSPSMAHCDGYDPETSTCGLSNGSVSLTGDGIWWNNTCQSNFYYRSSVPSGLNCGGSACNAFAEVVLVRNSHSASYCNNNNSICFNESDTAANECAQPGSCPVNTNLYFCAKLLSGCTGTSFHGEYIGTTSWWSSFESDMLWANTYAVIGCATFVNKNASNPSATKSAFVCGTWH